MKLRKNYKLYNFWRYVLGIQKEDRVKINDFSFKIGSWIYYKSKEYNSKIKNCGKWMLFFSRENYMFAKEICMEAAINNIVYTCKHTSFETDSLQKFSLTGVICFYLDGLSENQHKKVISFLKDKDLIRKTKTGKYFNISFKFDIQTLSGDYGKDFTPEIKLSDFVNLDTHEFIK
jgi:hypothetical protein